MSRTRQLINAFLIIAAVMLGIVGLWAGRFLPEPLGSICARIFHILTTPITHNLNVSEPGLFFKATDGTLFKVGPVAITSSGNAPNSAASGPSGNVAGETWLDGRASYANSVLKVYNGTQWVAGNGFQVDNATGDFQLSKTLTVSTLIVNGTGANTFIRLPNGTNAVEPTLPTAAGALYFNTTTNLYKSL